MKRILLLIAGLHAGFIALSQVTITNKGVDITNANTDIYIYGNYNHEPEATIANGGEIYISGNIANNSQNTIFVTNAGKVVLNGISLQNISGDSSINFYQLSVNNKGQGITLNQSVRIKDTLLLLLGNVNLNGNTINLGSTGFLVGEENSKRVYGTSGLIKADRILNNTNLNENIAGLGLYISSQNNFGNTVIERGHSQQRFTGDSSISRYYNFLPSYEGHIDTLKFTYLDSNETVPNEFLYKVFASLDNGTEWKNKGGLVDTIKDFIISTTVCPPDIFNARFSIFPTENFATCQPNDPNYISAIFLVASKALDGDSIKFVQLSTSNPTNYSWSFGDGITSLEESPFHSYQLTIDSVASVYSVTMTVTNGVCSDTRKKSIEINPNSFNLKKTVLFNGIEFVNIYPNPHSGTMNIEVKTNDVADLKIQVLNTQGIEVGNILERTSSFKRQLDFNDLSAGLYYLKFQVGEEVRVLKMIKM